MLVTVCDIVDALIDFGRCAVQLERRRVRVILASSGDEAIAMFTAHSEQIDAVGTCRRLECIVFRLMSLSSTDDLCYVVMDYLMPGKNGVQSAEALKRIMATLPPPASSPPPLVKHSSTGSSATGARTSYAVPIAVLSATFDGM